MRRPVLAIWGSMVALIALTTPAMAQRTTGEIIGKVLDESGGVLPGVTVTLRGAAVAGAPTTVTSDTGVYDSRAAASTTTSIHPLLPGLQARRHSGGGGSTGVDDAQGEHAREAITAGDAPVGTRQAQVSTSYNKEWVQNAGQAVLVLT